jgi:predicted  nucleic acid-binding Zn-ribbon protein
MESLTSGTIAGSGSFRCRRCGYVLTLTGSDTLSDCPGCGGRAFVRASLFSGGANLGHAGSSTAEARRRIVSRSGAFVTGAMRTGRFDKRAGSLFRAEPIDGEAWLQNVRAQIAEPGDYLAYEADSELKLVPLTREWTRIGRSLAADVRFDDPTVSRRHALVVRQADGVRMLDDRSLNGVFVNGSRIEWKVLRDGDEILVGRYRLRFLSVIAQVSDAPGASTVDRAAGQM